MSFRPLRDRVVVKRLESNERTEGGIIIPDNAQEKQQEGEILAVGPGIVDERGVFNPLTVSVGDRIIFGKWSGSELNIEGEDVIILQESDIIGVIE